MVVEGAYYLNRIVFLVMLVFRCVSCVVFFFQAEDGIRDWSVTGVQTCALPISAPVQNALACADTQAPKPSALQRTVIPPDSTRRWPSRSSFSAALPLPLLTYR